MIARNNCNRQSDDDESYPSLVSGKRLSDVPQITFVDFDYKFQEDPLISESQQKQALRDYAALVLMDWLAAWDLGAVELAVPLEEVVVASDWILAGLRPV